MTSKFAQLKNKSTDLLTQFTGEADKETSKQEYGDDARFWRPDVDKAGNGYAIVRFLPIPPSDEGKIEAPWVKLYNHGFQGPTGQWYIELSRTTLGESDPASEYNTVLWNSKDKDKVEQARKQKRKLSYISNVLIIKDDKHPENEGKVFLYRYGKKVFEKLNAAMKPEFPGDPKFNPFDFWEGANFKIKIKFVDGYRNYNNSEFDRQSALFDGDEKRLEELWMTEHSLFEHVDPARFKPYAELKKSLERVLGTIDIGVASRPLPNTDDDDEDFVDTSKVPEITKSSTSKVSPVSVAGEEESEDDDYKFFKKLAG